MYGQIHVIVRSLILEKFGEETWRKILDQSGFDDPDFMVFHYYTDERTLILIGTVSEILDLPVPAVLEVFGGYFYTYCKENGYDKMLATLGGNIVSFIQNLDSLHALLAMTYKEIEAPSFRCIPKSDGTVELHYYTNRKGLHPIVIGTLKELGKDLFNLDLSIEVAKHEEIIVDENTVQQHVTFILMGANDTKTIANVENIKFKPYFPKDFVTPAKSLCSALPYHIVFDKNLVIKQTGLFLQNLCPELTKAGTKLTDVFELLHPVMSLTHSNLMYFINASYVIGVKNEFVIDEKRSDIARHTLEGQMVWLEEIDHLIFLCSPRLDSLEEMMSMNVFLADIPMFDVTRKLVLLSQQRNAELEISKKLDETTAALKTTMKELDEAKAKVDSLLNEMLPPKVSKQLQEGKKVDAEKFEGVTIFFSDVVKFTNICAACTPIDVVNMLNGLYGYFDNLTIKHGVYKVETIGDAYMVVCGLPEVDADHCQKVACFSLDMVVTAGLVKSPATGIPLMIRAGLHSGPVVSGVVGEKMPRYCLFGDTVNTASRMESNGQPGRVHCSGDTAKILSTLTGFKTKTRGVVDIKGKGKMETHFLYKDPTKQIEHDDENEPLIILNGAHLEHPEYIGPDGPPKGAVDPKTAIYVPKVSSTTPPTNGELKTDKPAPERKPSGVCNVS
ncbi:unnamed protein product [Owenia fusiformis]|uniref:guanylate cyclase n=1 Tax=Owenia fusiformis TaxID=6347 RepID=A0A8J1XH79_OWEFU|nr:unnamed protein product [Owenia fusiformis]